MEPPVNVAITSLIRDTGVMKPLTALVVVPAAISPLSTQFALASATVNGVMLYCILYETVPVIVHTTAALNGTIDGSRLMDGVVAAVV